MSIVTRAAAQSDRNGAAAQARAANRRKSTGMSSSRTPTERGRTAPTVARTAATAAQPAPGPVPALTGAILDRYTLGRRVGSGAFGSVWMARDEHLQRDVAVKILARERGPARRVRRE